MRPHKRNSTRLWFQQDEYPLLIRGWLRPHIPYALLPVAWIRGLNMTFANQWPHEAGKACTKHDKGRKPVWQENFSVWPWELVHHPVGEVIGLNIRCINGALSMTYNHYHTDNVPKDRADKCEEGPYLAFDHDPHLPTTTVTQTTHPSDVQPLLHR